MARLLHSLNTVRGDPSKDIHLALELKHIYEEVEQTGSLDEETRLELNEINSSSIIPDILRSVERWYAEHDFEAAQEGLSHIEDAISEAIGNNWLSVSAEYYYYLIKLKSDLSGYDAGSEMSAALEFLIENAESVSPNIATDISNFILENIGDTEEELLEKWKEFVQDGIELANSANSFDTERVYLRQLHRAKSSFDEQTEEVENSLIDTYRLEANFQEEHSLLVKADILRSGINECGQFMDEELEEEWKQEALEARKEGTEKEMVHITPDELANSEYEGDLQDDLNDEVSRNIDTIVNFFEEMSSENGSTYALYCLLLSDGLFPDSVRMRLQTEQFVLTELVSRMTISPEYNTVSSGFSDQNRLPSNYALNATSSVNATANALYQLIKQGQLTLSDFIRLLRIGDSISPDTEAFLMHALIELFKDNHVQSLFISVPHLEAVFVDSLSHVGKTAYTMNEEGTQQRMLGGLISETEALGDSYSTYLRYQYTSREGMNLRNRVSHGQLRYTNANYLNSILAIYDITKIMVKINSSPYLGAFGPPAETISPPTNYGRDIDLSLFTDVNKQIVGYGQTDDEHTVVVVRKDRNEDETNLFIDRGRISTYELGSFEMNHEDIINQIEEMSSENVEIPSGIEYEWLTDEMIIDEIQSLLENELFEDGVERISLDSIFQGASRRGIDESTARLAIDQLESDGRITQSEEEVWLN